MKKIVHITEGELKNIISENVRKILEDSSNNNMTLIHNDVGRLRELFKIAYKCVYKISNRYSIEFQRDDHKWDKMFYGGAIFVLCLKTRMLDKVFPKGVGSIEIKEVNPTVDEFCKYNWIKNLSKLDNARKILIQVNESWTAIIDENQLEEYIKKGIYAIHSYNMENYKDYLCDGGDFYTIFNDNILNVLANDIK